MTKKIGMSKSSPLITPYGSLIFSDHFDGGTDFMMCSPMRSTPPSTDSPKYNYNYAPHVMQMQSLVGCSSPRFSSLLGPNRGKVESPLKRAMNSLHNQFKAVESHSLPALGSLLDDKSADCFDYLSGVHELSNCLTTRFCVSDDANSVQGSPNGQYQQLHQQNQLHNTHNTLMVPILVPEQENDSGQQLVHLLLASAEAVSKGDHMLARRYLHQLNQVVSPLGDSMQRVAACFNEALTARLATNKPSTSTLKPPTLFPADNQEILWIYQILYQACPYIKFAHFTANQAIFEAFEAEERVHVIDLDILHGYQWPAFMQALAARPGGSPFLRITGVGPSTEDVKETGRCLTELAQSLHIPFEFHHIGEELEDLKPHMFNRRVGEALAVNAVNRLHRVPGDFLGNLLTMIRDQAPNIVTIVEQEASHNGPYFIGRFLEALHYYSAIFDSLDATFPPDSTERAKVEQYIFAPEIRNIVAHEGPERVLRHERLEKWKEIMDGKGFQGVPLSENGVIQSRILLGSYSCDGYRLTEDKGCLLLGWQDRAILAASAWRC